MHNEKDIQTTNPETAETDDRREALKKLGKYSAYLAPFTVLALSKKASAATGGGTAPASRHR
jgi:hypothetical protein